MEYIAKTDSRESIKVRVENLPGITNLIMLDKKDRARFEVFEEGEADYYLTNFRRSMDLYDKPGLYFVRADGIKILGVLN